MYDDCERSFSSGRDLVTYRCSNLLSDNIEACELLRNWYGKPRLSRQRDEHGNDHRVPPFDDEEQVHKQWASKHQDKAEGSQGDLAGSSTSDPIDI